MRWTYLVLLDRKHEDGEHQLERKERLDEDPLCATSTRSKRGSDPKRTREKLVNHDSGDHSGHHLRDKDDDCALPGEFVDEEETQRDARVE